MNAGIPVLAPLAKHVATFQVHMSVGMQLKVFLSTMFTTTRSKVYVLSSWFAPLSHYSKCLNVSSILFSYIYFAQLLYSLLEDLCHENAVRHIINGTTECFCKQGYYGNGINCTGMLKI